MADTKRHSIASKVATPKSVTGGGSPALQPVPDVLETLDKAIGAKIKLTTAAPHSQTFEGTLFTADPIINVVVINTRHQSTERQAGSVATAQNGDFHVIPVSRIQSFNINTVTPSPSSSLPSALTPIGPVDLKHVKAREEARIAKLKEEERHRGKGVTREAQAIYDSFKRINMPIRWHNQEMIVHEAVIIAPPYRVEDCKGARDKQETLNRVRKVLDGERKKLKDKDTQNGKVAAAATTAAPRKGG